MSTFPYTAGMMLVLRWRDKRNPPLCLALELFSCKLNMLGRSCRETRYMTPLHFGRSNQLTASAPPRLHVGLWYVLYLELIIYCSM